VFAHSVAPRRGASLITWERTASVRRPAFSSPLFTEVIRPLVAAVKCSTLCAVVCTSFFLSNELIGVTVASRVLRVLGNLLILSAKEVG